MKLTKQKLYKLILEELSSSEEEYYGSNFSQMTKGNDAFEDPDFAWIKKNVGKELGKGGSRIVFELGKDKVVKIAYGDEEQDGRQTNFIEGKIFNKHPNIFPRVYAFDPDGKWMVCDRVEVVPYKEADPDGNEERFANAFANAFPIVDKFLQLLKNYKPDAEQNEGRIKEFFWDGVKGKWNLWILFRKIYNSSSPDDEKMRSERFTKALEDYDYPKALIEQGWDLLNKDSKLMEFLLTLRSLRVSLWDIRAGNVGLTMKDKRFVIIDVSIFYDDQSALYKKLKTSRKKDPSEPYDNRKKDINQDPDYERVGPGQWRRK
tara:strand:- start:48 stop:1001 length:954 start_codon:yes stop_codon:yes gene_type:complete